MNDKPKERFISLREASDRLGITDTSIRQRKCGTEKLTHVRPGGAKRVLLVESEVDQLVDDWIRRARSQRPDIVIERLLKVV